MKHFARRGGGGLIALLLFATAGASAAAPMPGVEVTVASIPLFARFATDDGSLHGYQAPVHMSGWLHKFFFTFHFSRDGVVKFREPDSLRFAFDSIPHKYSSMFDQLGTPRTWPAIYDLQCVKAIQTANGMEYEIHGVPKDSSSDVASIVIHMNDRGGPITAQWALRDGWSVTSTIQMESVNDFLVPKEEATDVDGHGYRIHTDVTYGNYELLSAA